MAYVEDVAASASASWADAFSSQLGLTFGSKNYSFGSGAQTVTQRTDQSPRAETDPVARAVSATAKAGDGGVADATAMMSGDTIPSTIAGIDIKTIAIAALALLAIGLGYFGLKKKGKR